MKTAVIVLVLFGILAAGAATFLIQVVDFRLKGDEVPKIGVLVADANLPARTRLTQEHVKLEKAAKAGLPLGYFTTPAQAIGKVLRVPIVRGQALTDSLFLAKGSIDDLLQPGMRAFPISLSGRSTPVDLLYPGCIVDVFATFALSGGNNSAADAVVVPLLQKIQVLAVADRTVMTTAQDAAKSGSQRSGSGSVTLEVTPTQVAALQLALQGGTLGLAMRNANDKGLESMDPMSRKGARLSVDPVTLALLRRIHETLGKESAIDPDSLQTSEQGTAQPAAPQTSPVATANSATAEPAPGAGEDRSSNRSVTVIRANKREETVVKDAQGGDPNAPQAAGTSETLQEGGSDNR